PCPYVPPRPGNFQEPLTSCYVSGARGLRIATMKLGNLLWRVSQVVRGLPCSLVRTKSMPIDEVKQLATGYLRVEDFFYDLLHLPLHFDRWWRGDDAPRNNISSVPL